MSAFAPSRLSTLLRSIFIGFWLLVLPALSARAEMTYDAAEQPRLEHDTTASGALRLSWFGRAGRSYFIEQTRDLAGLPWQYLPVIETGADAPLAYVFGSVPEPAFFARLRISDQTAPDPRVADFDGDGISNLDELIHHLDPLGDADGDSDGFPDDWERFYFGDILQTGDHDADQNGDGITDWESKLLGINPAGQPSDRDPPLWVGGDELAVVSETPALLVISWPEAEDVGGGPATYMLYRNGAPQGTPLTDPACEIDLSGLAGWQRWHVRPRDAAGNLGAPSSTIERQINAIIDATFSAHSHSVEGTQSFWGFSRSGEDGGTLYFETQTSTWTWTHDYYRDDYDDYGFTGNGMSEFSTGSITSVAVMPMGGPESQTVSGSFSGDAASWNKFNDGNSWDLTGTITPEGGYSGTKNTYVTTGGSRVLVGTEPSSEIYSSVEPNTLVSSTPQQDIYQFIDPYPAPPNPGETFIREAQEVVDYSNPVEAGDVEGALRAGLPALDTVAWGSGAFCAAREWSASGQSLRLCEGEYRIHLDDTTSGLRHRVRWLEVFYPSGGEGRPSALASRQIILDGTGGVAESGTFQLVVPQDKQGTLCLVPVALSFDAPALLGVNEDFDERVEPDPEDEAAEPPAWVPDSGTASPLRADGTLALEDLAPVWIGSNGSSGSDRFGAETDGVRISIAEGADRVRMIAVAPTGSGENGAFTDADWTELESGEELWGQCFGRTGPGGVRLPDWTVYLEGLQPGKVVLSLEVDRYGAALTQESTLFVTRVELVGRDRDTGEIVPASGETQGRTPQPAVELHVESASLLDQQTLQVRLTGVVRDALSEIIRNPADRVAALMFYVNGEAVEGLSDLPALADGPAGIRPWQPRTFEAAFSHTLTIPVSAPGSIIVQARTTPNAAGQRGWADVMVHLARPASGNPPPPLMPAYLEWSSAPGAGTADQVRVHLGSVLHPPASQVLTETAAHSGAFAGSMLVDGQERTANLVLALPPADQPWPVGVDGLLVYQNAAGSAMHLDGHWERETDRPLVYRLVRTFPRYDLRPPLVIESVSELGGTQGEGFAPAVLRIDGLQEADDENLPAGLLIDGDGLQPKEMGLRPFVFSPEYHYLVNPDLPGAPALMIASSPVLYGQEEQLRVLKAGRQNFTLLVKGRPAIEGTSVHAVAGNGPSEPPADEQSRPITLDEVMFWYEFLFDRPEAPKTQGKPTPIYLRDLFTSANCAYQMVGGQEVSGHYIHPIIPKRLLIEIGAEGDPINAAIGLLEAYESLCHTAPVYERIISDGIAGLELLSQRNVAAKQAIAPLREYGLAVMEAQFAFMNEGADIAMSLQEVADGNMYAAIGIIPGIPTSVNKLIIGSAAGGAVGKLILQGPALGAFKSYVADIKPMLRHSKRFADRVLGSEGARARLIFMNNVGHLLSRDQLAIMYDKLSVLRSDKNRSVLESRLVANKIPKPGTNYAPHHDLPLEFERDFILAGIDPNHHEYGRWIPAAIHDRWSNAPGFRSGGPFNDEWRRFFRNKDNVEIVRTRNEVLAELDRIRAMPQFKYP